MNNDSPDNIASEPEYAAGQWVTGVISRITPIGIIVNLDDHTEGLLFKDEVFRELTRGEEVKVYIKQVRPDGKIDLALNKGGYKNFIEDSTEVIMAELAKAGGFMAITDKSAPEDIYEKFQISKKKFKEAIGALYKSRRITISDTGITLVK